MSSQTLKAFAAAVRSIPVNRGKGRLCNLAMSVFGKGSHDFLFKSNRLDITWSARGYPDLLTRHMLFEGMYQEDVICAIQALLKPGNVMFDVGGHHGLMAIVGAKAVSPGGRVISFEPNPIARELFRHHLQINDIKNVTIEEHALNDREGELSFYIQTGEVSWNSSFFKDFVEKENKGKETNDIREITVRTETMDAYVERTGNIPDLIKIDTEGADFFILGGAMETLKKHRPALILELNPQSALDAGTTIETFRTFLLDCGYELFVPRRSLAGFYSFDDKVAFDPEQHCSSQLCNAVCVPTR